MFASFTKHTLSVQQVNQQLSTVDSVTLSWLDQATGIKDEMLKAIGLFFYHCSGFLL